MVGCGMRHRPPPRQPAGAPPGRGGRRERGDAPDRAGAAPRHPAGPRRHALVPAAIPVRGRHVRLRSDWAPQDSGGRRGDLPGPLYLRTHEDASGTIVRLAFSARRGDRSILRYHFLVGRPRRGVEYHEVEDVGLLLSRQELLGWMRNAGLHARWIARGLTPGRGLLVGTKVEGIPSRRPAAPVPRARSGPGPR